MAFTLIELLAVIVILAIIALIATPIVVNIIKDTKRNSFIQTANGIIDAAEYYYANEVLDGVKLEEYKEFTFPNYIEGLEFDGEVPKEGSIVINPEGKIAVAISNGVYCVTKWYDEVDIKVNNELVECTVPKILSQIAVVDESLGVNEVDECAKKGEVCTNGTNGTEPTAFAIKVNDIETYKFYVINDNGEEVTLIMNSNLYEGNSVNVAWNSGSDNSKGPIIALTALKKRTSGWENITAYTYKLEKDDDGKGGSYGYTEVTGEVVQNVRARLPKYSEIKSIKTANGGITPSYLYINLKETGDDNTSAYWTSTARASLLTDAWYVSCYGALNVHVIGAGGIGIRPVITISK